jgi:phospholipid/cholesterol/gamma-HCH transport system permease protein
MADTLLPRIHHPVRRFERVLMREWHFLLFAAATLLAMLSPATYVRPVRRAMAQSICFSAWQVLPGYALMVVLFGAAMTHIVVVTAASYGLSHLALEAVVRVLVVELIPLVAALFVVMRSGMALLNRLADLRAEGVDLRQPAVFDQQVLPGVVGNLFAVMLLTLVSGSLLLCVAYLVVYGLTPWGLPGFTQLVGQVFDPITAPGLLLKMFLFALAVGVVPATQILDPLRRVMVGNEMRITARLFLTLALIEAGALVLLHF